MNNLAVEVLLIEDNPDDAELTIRVLNKHHLANNLVHLQDGEEALRWNRSVAQNQGRRTQTNDPYCYSYLLEGRTGHHRNLSVRSKCLCG